MFRWLRPSVLLLLTALLLAGCASTKLLSSWSDPNWAGRPMKSFLIVGVMENDIQRKMYEDLFVARIAGEGVSGIAAYTLLPEAGANYDEEAIREAVARSGADGAIIARLQGVTRQERYVPPTYEYEPAFGARRGFYRYYGMAYRYQLSPGYTTVDTVVELETTVFSVQTENMVWAGTTRSFNPSSTKSVIEKNADLIIGDMKKAGLL